MASRASNCAWVIGWSVLLMLQREMVLKPFSRAMASSFLPNVRDKANALFIGIQDGHQIFQIGVANDLFCFKLANDGLVNGNFHKGSIEAALHLRGRGSQRNDRCVLIAHGSFQTEAGNATQIWGLFKILILHQAVKLVADDVFKMLVKVGVL